MAALTTGDLITATALSQIDSTGSFTNSVTVGDGTSTDKDITFNIGSGTSNPKIAYDSGNNRLNINMGTASQLRIANGDGTSYLLTFNTNGDLVISGTITDSEDIT